MIPAKASAVGRQLEVLWTSGTLSGLSDAQLLGRFAGGGGRRRPSRPSASWWIGTGRWCWGSAARSSGAPTTRTTPSRRRSWSWCGRPVRSGWATRSPPGSTAWPTGRRIGRGRPRRDTGPPTSSRWRQPPRPAPDGSFELDVRPLLHEELARLPGKYREPIVLCHLEGKSHEEAARLLSLAGRHGQRPALARPAAPEVPARTARRGRPVGDALGALADRHSGRPGALPGRIHPQRRGPVRRGRRSRSPPRSSP